MNNEVYAILKITIFARKLKIYLKDRVQKII